MHLGPGAGGEFLFESLMEVSVQRSATQSGAAVHASPTFLAIIPGEFLRVSNRLSHAAGAAGVGRLGRCARYVGLQLLLCRVAVGYACFCFPQPFLDLHS